MTPFARFTWLPASRKAVWVAAMLLALLLAQALGLAHGVLHASPARHAERHAQHHHSAVEHSALLQGLAALFDDHEDEGDCRLYDQASHGQAASSVVACDMTAAAPSQAVPLFQGEALARWAALFDARGPPLTR